MEQQTVFLLQHYETESEVKQMVRTDLLAGYIAMRGKKRKEVSDALKIKPTTLRRKLETGYFTCDEALILTELLSITDPVSVFLCNPISETERNF